MKGHSVCKLLRLSKAVGQRQTSGAGSHRGREHRTRQGGPADHRNRVQIALSLDASAFRNVGSTDKSGVALRRSATGFLTPSAQYRRL